MDYNYIEEEQLFVRADKFLAHVSGLDEFGRPKAAILMRIGGSETSHAQEYDLGPVELTKKNMQGCYILNLKFSSLEQLKTFHRIISDYANYIDIKDGAVDENHILSLIIFTNDDFAFAEGYAIAQLPVLFGLTASEPGAATDSYQISFRKDTLFYFDVEELLRREEEKTDVPSEESNIAGNGDWSGTENWVSHL